MVCGLAGNVSLHALKLRWADAKCAVTFLPREQSRAFPHESAGVCLEHADCIREAGVRRKGQKYVDVILCSTNRERLDAVIPRDAGKVVPQAILSGSGELARASKTGLA
jgi:hypothetical protein